MQHPNRSSRARSAGLATLTLFTAAQGRGSTLPNESRKSIAQLKLKTNPAIEKRVDALLSQLRLKEKISFCSGDNGQFRGLSRLEIPPLYLTDGPRGPNNSGPATAFPCGVSSGSTWDPVLIQSAGKVMGEETRAAGEGILLGPGINIIRDPLGGRDFEYYTEDPYLSLRLAVSIVDGIQSEGVAACLKHYVCNNREDNRNFYMSMVDPQTLNEIYFPGFKAAVEQGNVWAVMTSANGVNGDFVSDSKLLLQDTLKDKWGFSGMVITDWLQARSTVKSALAGLDISMPGGDCRFAQPLLDAVKVGQVPIGTIDDKVRRVLPAGQTSTMVSSAPSVSLCELFGVILCAINGVSNSSLSNHETNQS